MRPIAWVTGANRGIGRGCTVALASRGFDIVAIDLEENEDTAETQREAISAGAGFTFVAGNIADGDCYATMIAQALRAGPGPASR